MNFVSFEEERENSEKSERIVLNLGHGVRLRDDDSDDGSNDEKEENDEEDERDFGLTATG